MLPRRHIRIKVFQTLYARSQKNQDTKLDTLKEYKKNLTSYLNIYFFIIDLLTSIKETAITKLELKRKKIIRNNENIIPNQRFVQNYILKQLKGKKIKNNHIREDKIKVIAKKIFTQIQKSNTYIGYMKKPQISQEDEKKIIFHILKKYVIGNEQIHDFIEEYSIYWNDDILIAYNFLMEKINKNEEINSIELFRKKEDQLFGESLLKKTIEKEKEISKLIYELVINWDEERIATIDLILMKMALAEMRHIEEKIPNKVSLDEYIEISKQYSTPKSKEFINGLLDVFMKDILPKNINE